MCKHSLMWGRRKAIKKFSLVNSFSRCSWRTAETGSMLRSGLDHRDVNIFTWVSNMLGCAIKIRESRNQRGRRLFICYRKRNKHLQDIGSNAEQSWSFGSKSSGQGPSFSYFVPAVHLSLQVISAVKAMSTLRTLQGEIIICICPFAALHQRSIRDERKGLVSWMDLFFINFWCQWARSCPLFSVWARSTFHVVPLSTLSSVMHCTQ